MPPDDGRAAFLREPAAHQLAQVGEAFARIAQAVAGRESAERVAAACADAERCCDWASEGAQPAQTKALLENVTTAVRTWREVWPRLGGRTEFRQAVAREADRWARQFESTRRASARP